MRFFLALWVVVYHQNAGAGLAVSWLPGAPDAVYSLLRVGYVAVTVFFVLSGFVLAYNYDLGALWPRKRTASFAIARFARIYPAYCVGLFLLVPFAVYRVGHSIVLPDEQVTSGVLNALLLQAWIPQTALTWNYPGWSLSNEVFFYACFPFIGLGLWRISRPRTILAAGLLIWAVSLVAPLWAVMKPVPGFGNVAATDMLAPSALTLANFIRYNPVLRLPEFLSGILLARMYRSLGHSWLFGRGYWLYVPATAAVLAVLSHADSIPYPLVHNSLLLPLYACIVLGLALGGGIPARCLSAGFLVFLGNASYAMYIIHAPIGAWLLEALKHLFGFQPAGPWWVASYTITVILLSSLLFKYFEEPLTALIKKRVGGRAGRSVSQGATVIAATRAAAAAPMLPE